MQRQEIIVPNCPHLNQVENFENSFMVCTDCGLEVQQIYCNPPLSSCDVKWFDEQSYFKYYKDPQFDFIDNCVRRDNIPDSCTYEIYDLYRKEKLETTQTTDMNQVAALAIYNWKRSTISAGLTADDVSALTHVKKKHLFKCEKKKRGPVPINDVKSILNAAPLEELDLKQNDRLLLQSISSKFQDNDCSPKSIASALVHLYISASGKKCTNNKIIKMFTISNMTLYRTKQKIEERAICILTKLLQRKLNKKIA